MCKLQGYRSEKLKGRDPNRIHEVPSQSPRSAFASLITRQYSVIVSGFGGRPISSTPWSHNSGKAEQPSWFVCTWGLKVLHLWSSQSLATVARTVSSSHQRSRIYLLGKYATLSQSTRPTSGLVPRGSMAALVGQIGESGLSAIQLTLLINEIQKVLLKTQNLQQKCFAV